MKGVFLDFETLDQQDLDFSILTSTLDQWDLWPSTTSEEIVSRIENAHLIVTNKVRLTEEVLQHAPLLRCICVSATGVDNVDLKYARQRGITVCNVKGYSTASVIQHAIGLLIMLASRLNDYVQLVKEGAWINAKHFCLQNFRTTELEGKVLGIVGYGAIGKGVAEIAKCLGMKVLVAKRQNDKYDLASFLPQIDVLSLHCPLTKETQQMIGFDELALMKKGSLLINVSRGGLIEEKALKEALSSHHLGGAAIDVVTNEPPKPDSDLFSTVLPNFIVTPHVAWATVEARRRLLSEITKNVLNFSKGTPSNVVE